VPARKVIHKMHRIRHRGQRKVIVCILSGVRGVRHLIHPPNLLPPMAES